MRIGTLKRLFVAGILAFATSPAMAGWKVAETRHFIYYSEAEEAEMREAVTKLETFDTLVRALTGNSRPASPIKVTIFEVATMDDVNRTFPYPSEGVGGYYSSTIEGPFLVTFRNNLRSSMSSARRSASSSIEWGPEVRQHEYLHHYMYQYFNANYPSWYSEGFAEYYGTMAFPASGVVEIGHAPHFRMNAIKNGSWIHVRDILTAKSYADVRDLGALYAQGWLLTHLGAQNKERGFQLKKYLNGVANGEEYAKAATDAFGDLDALDSDLRDHMKGLSAMRLSLKPIVVGEIQFRQLNALEDQMMRYEIRKYSGFELVDLPLTLAAIRKLRQTDPDNVMGLRIQAELENLAGEFDLALASTERLLRLDPGNIQGLTERGRALLGQLDRQANSAAWEAARDPLRDAIATSAIAIEPRVLLFRSYIAEGELPTVEAQNHLVEAFNHLPQNDEIRVLLASDFEMRGLFEDAIAVIEPAAFGSFDGDEKEKKKRRKFLEQAADRFSNVTLFEDPADMLKRLIAKRNGMWDEATGTISDPG